MACGKGRAADARGRHAVSRLDEGPFRGCVRGRQGPVVPPGGVGGKAKGAGCIAPMTCTGGHRVTWRQSSPSTSLICAQIFRTLGDASHGETGFTVSTDGEPVLAHSSHLVDYMKYIYAKRESPRDRVQPRGQCYDESWPRRASVHVLEARERSHRGSTHYPTHSLPDLRGAGVRVLKRVYTSCGARSCKHAPCGGVFHEHLDKMVMD